MIRNNSRNYSGIEPWRRFVSRFHSKNAFVHQKPLCCQYSSATFARVAEQLSLNT